MRHAYAHDAVVRLDPDGDPAAPGGAITIALCGHWEHPPPCPLAPHHTAAVPVGDELALRVLFAAEPADEAQVRATIQRSLASGHLVDPNGRTTAWTFRSAAPGVPRADEADHAARLLGEQA